MRQTFSPAKCAVLKFAAQIFRMQQSELVPHIHPFAAACGADSSSSDLHSGKSNFRARFLPSHRDSPAMATFRSRSSLLLQNGLVRTAPVEWFYLSLAPESANIGKLRLLYIGWHIINTNPKSCVFSSVTIHDISLFCKSLCSFFFYPTICKSPPGDRGGPFAAAIHQSIQSSAQPCSSAERRGFAAEAEGAGAVR